MSEMLDRVAEGIRNAMGDQHGCSWDQCCCSGPDETFECQMGVTIETLAMAAIKAMRNPTEGMIAKGAYHCEWESFGLGTDGKPEARDCYVAMMDAALADDVARETK